MGIGFALHVSYCVSRIAGSFIAAALVGLAVLYVPQWQVKAALLAGASGASLSIIFNPDTRHRRTALCLLLLVGAAQISFGLYGHSNPAPEAGAGGYVVLEGPAVIVQVTLVLAAVAIYVIGEMYGKLNK